MFASIFDDSLSLFEYVVNHVFSPVYHPEKEDFTPRNAYTLACAVHAAACTYREIIDDVHKPRWIHVIRMLENLKAIIKPRELDPENEYMAFEAIIEDTKFDPDQVISQLVGMKTGDILSFCLPTCGVIFRRRDHCTLHELLYVVQDCISPGRVGRSHPELAIEIPNESFDDEDFQLELAGLLSGRKEITDMIRRVGSPVEPERITKHFPTQLKSSTKHRPFVGYPHGARRESDSWSRVDLWYFVKVAIQSSLDRSPLGRAAYKAFMLFFMCNLANQALCASLSGPLIHSMSVKILRRLRKLGHSVSYGLHDSALHVCTSLSQILDKRWQELQATQVSSVLWDPAQLDLVKDIQPLLHDIYEYISTSLEDSGGNPPLRPFFPSSRRQLTLSDRSRWENHGMRDVDSHVTLYDVERAVREEIDDWVAGITDVDEACQQLETMIIGYHSSAQCAYSLRAVPTDSDHLSIMLLTIIELWVALDKLVVKEIPMLADYSPQISLDLIRGLLLSDAASIHRFCRAYQYLSSRHARARPGWSVFSNQFTEQSFPCCYYDSSPHHQDFKARIEDTLPAEPLYAKVVVFELQCPVSFDVWRSVTHWISPGEEFTKEDKKDIHIRDIAALRPHVLGNHRRRRLIIPRLYSSPLAPERWERLYYVYEGSSLCRFRHTYNLPRGLYEDSQMQQYLDDTTHLPNNVLANQACCKSGISSREFVAFSSLRSGGSLQWINILRELRSGTLNIRHPEVYLLLARASIQAGPLDYTGELLWHQELQETSFCHVLLGELESLYIDIATSSLDGPAMAIISLLTGVLASTSSRDISERAVQLLQNVRRKTFGWVHELLYDVRNAPTDEDTLALLRDMAAICRSTFNVGCGGPCRQLFQSAQDIEIALSCALLIPTIHHNTSYSSTYSAVLMSRHRRLCFVLEGCLRDTIEAHASNIGVDRAVQLVWPGYRPGPRRWRSLDSPHSHWLVCETAPARDGHSQTVHVDLLDGSLFVDGKPMGTKLPSAVTWDEGYRTLFGDHAVVVIASDLPGMNFVTISAVPGHRVHFGFRRDQKVIIRAQSQDTDDIFELLPRTELQSSLPLALVDGHVHWLNLSSSIIEIRPMEKLWEHSEMNWKFHFQSGQYRVTKGGEFLVDKQSPTWLMVSSRFQCLEDSQNLIITVSPVDSPLSPLLSVTLPRYGLSFFVNEVGTLESQDFKGMVYDEDQCIGTLFGLVNKLVLRPKAEIEADLIPKRIVVPYSTVLRVRQPNVHVQLPPSGSLTYYTYQVDKELGCLRGITSLEDRLYLARLHFLTNSECRPDPLTGRTGAEEAISLIWLAGIRERGRDSDSLRSMPESPQAEGTFAPVWPGRPNAITQERPGDNWCSMSRSSQIRLAFAMLDRDYDEQTPTSEDALLQEAYLFPSEVTARVRLGSSGKYFILSLEQLLLERSPPNLQACDQLAQPRHDSACNGHSNNDSLRQLFSSLRTNQTAPPFQSQYLSRLHDSAQHFRTTDLIVVCQADSWKPGISTLRRHYAQCRTIYAESVNLIKNTLGPKTCFEGILDQCGQWPRVTPFILLRCLATTSPIKLRENWKRCLISLALLALNLQRARRLLQFALENLEEELYNELNNEGCDGWDATEHPDWLLIQLQGNFLIRRTQADVAKEMILPRSGKNTAMQVNMGEGKTSVIIPICAAALADGHHLARVIVPKPLIPHTLHILNGLLSGLVNKPIYHLTFSRDDMKNLKNNRKKLNKVKRMQRFMSRCRGESGVIVMQPEHVVSLKLSCVETQIVGNRTGTMSGPIVWKQGSKLDRGIIGESTPVVPERGFKRVLNMVADSLMNLPSKIVHVSSMMERVKQPSPPDPGTLWDSESIGSEDSSASVMSIESENETTEMQAGFIELQMFLETHSRDILDESDDVLRSQFQLIYATGHQHPFEGSPDRWVVVQQVLGLVKQHAYLFSNQESPTMRCDGGSYGSFPHIHILKAEDGEQLVSLIAEDVLDGRIPGLSFHTELVRGSKGVVREFMLRKDVHPDTLRVVEKHVHQSTSWSSLLLLRGLLAHNVLLFALTQRRWRVDYGLHLASPPRTMLAVPYRAKDVPAETAEFGHPDIAILLTCLSYYYGGLSEGQLRISFEFLLQQDDPPSEYAQWLEDCDAASVPDPLRQLSGVNIRSREQWVTHLIPLFARNKRAIDMYLAKVVFPRNAKEFPQRISGSSWDLAEQKKHLVTGFSGTNDGQYLLPTSISQDDPDHLGQTGTNAKALAYLLQPENSSYMVTIDKNGERWTTPKLLERMVSQKPQIRVLIDVGAQILDLSNLRLAKAWLDSIPAAEADGAIYFSEDDRLMVLARNGTTQPLSTSPLVHRLHRCVAYLDDAHTRGTDLKFPLGFRAAVTLGHKVTKDRLVQGCMRMRRLGHGHSVMFFAPHEVDQRIRGLVAKQNRGVPVTTADILQWAITETWCDIQRQAPHWAQQGMNHQSRSEGWFRFCQNEVTPKHLAVAWIQPELKSLADLYMPYHSPKTTSSSNLPRQIHERCEEFGVLSLQDVHFDEEQEREVSCEIEREREVQDPPTPSPAEHFLHPDVAQLVRTGTVPPPSSGEAFRHVFVPGVKNTSSGLHTWSPNILATVDFCETIEENESLQGKMNDYLRPVQWILSAKMGGKDAIILLSPFEVEVLMPEIRISEHVHLHLYIPRTTKHMKPSDDLRSYAIPPLPSDWSPPWELIDQLNMFAGQLYLSDYTSYLRLLCLFLGIHTEDIPGKPGTVVARNWFRNPGPGLADAEIQDKLKGTRLPLVMQLFTARRGMNLAGTHMGRILDGIPLTEADF